MVRGSAPRNCHPIVTRAQTPRHREDPFCALHGGSPMTMDYLIHLANYSDGVLYLMVAILTVALAVIIDRFCSGTCAAPFYKAIAWWGAWGPSTRPPGPHSRAWPLWPPSCRRPCYWMWRLGIGGLIMAVMVVLGLMCPILVTTGLRQKPRSAHLVAPPRPLPPFRRSPRWCR